MNTKDFSTITAIGVLAIALAAFLAGFGVAVPLWIPAAAPLAAGVVLFGLRAYVALVGPANTSVDERLAAAQDLIASVRDAVPAAFPASEAPTKKEVPR